MADFSRVQLCICYELLYIYFEFYYIMLLYYYALLILYTSTFEKCLMSFCSHERDFHDLSQK